MDNQKNDNYYLEKIRMDMLFITSHMLNITLDKFGEDEVLLDSMMFRMIQISESARKLSDECKTQYSSVPWNAIYGLRNRIVHDYGNVDLRVIFDTLTKDIPELLQLLVR